jgi:hypothetical protein
MKPSSIRAVRRVLGVLLLAGLGVPAVLAQAPPSGAAPVLIDRTLGEEEHILRRIEWFYSTRRAGTASAADLAALRARAMRETSEAIALQQARREDGVLAGDNFWSARGPSPSTFGGWAFGNVSGRVSALAADFASGTIYVGGASGGLWKSTNDGLSYEPLFDTAGTLTIGAIEVDPNDPNVLWVGTGENNMGCEDYFGIGLLRSTDGGETWEPRNGSGGSSLEDLSSFADVVVDPRDSSHIVTGGRIRGCVDGSTFAGGIYTSNDAGETWTRRLSAPVYEIQQDPAVRDVFWAATDQGIYKSTDNAVTWVKQTASGLPSSGTGRTELTIAPSDGDVVYALFASGTSGAEFWRTTNGGASWTQMSTGSNACDGQCWYNMVLRAHRTDPDTVYRGTIHIFKSTDGGANWTDLSNNWGSSQKVHQDTHALLMDPDDPETFWVGCDGGVWKSTDGGASFDNRNADLNLTQFYAIGMDASDGGVICGGSQDNSSLARSGSDTWDLQAVTGDGFVCHIDPLDSSYAYITSYPSGGYPNVWRSTTGLFGSFNDITGPGSGVQEGDRSNWVTPYILDPVQPSILYLGTHRVYKSYDHGSNWEHVGPDDMTNGSGTVLSLDVNRNYPEVVIAGTTDGRVWRSVNGGTDWADISAGLPSRSIKDVASDPTAPGRVLAVVGGFNTEHLWDWTEETGWVASGAGLPNVPTNTVLMLSDELVYVGSDTGVFRSDDGGATFAPYMNGLPEGLVVTDLKAVAALDLMTAGTYGRGAWQVALEPTGPIVIYDSYEQPLVEVDGDGDANVEPGETWQVRPLLRNVGSDAALGVTARLATDTPGVSVTDEVRAYGDIASGGTAAAASGYEFVVAPGYPCGEAILFDVVDITSTNDPGVYEDQLDVFSITVVDGYEDPIVTTVLDEDMDPVEQDWSHEAIDPNLFFCNLTYRDEWHLRQKDAAHGDSWHCGGGPGGTYARTDYSWLYLGGRDSLGGAGIALPADARAITLTLTHWYDTEYGYDGGQVVMDAFANGDDVYQTLEPEGGYPGDRLATGRCNGLEGEQAFQGDSGGWVTSTFDLTDWRGRTVWLAFVFGSDTSDTPDEGWYIDRVLIESEVQGAPICQVSAWPGEVPATALFSRLTDGRVEATWDDACNASSVTGQTYSLQAGDLSVLASSAAYDHAPVEGRCDRLSPATFTPGAGQEYYLVVSHHDGREGGAGADSNGTVRPQTSTVCGPRREGACP